MTARADRDRRRDGREPVCRECRYAPMIVVTDDLVGWWLDAGWTPADALPIAELFWGPRDTWSRDGTLSIRIVIEEASGYTGEDFAAIMSA